MEIKSIHIISFDVPYPANYGGVMDVFFRLKSLKSAGIQVILHCFDYGRGPAKELNNLVHQVHYYKRSMTLLQHMSPQAFIIKSRENEQLLKRLQEDDFPIWFEGLHTCGFIDHPSLLGRRKFVRTHNVEHEYYRGLASNTRKGIKQLYFQLESKKLKSSESLLQHADALFCISPADLNYFQSQSFKAFYLPAYVSDQAEVPLDSKIEDYALYHGNLGVSENQAAVDFLLSVFSDLAVPLVFAGQSAGSKLKKSVSKLNHVRLVDSPSEEEMGQLIAKSRMVCLPSFQSSGVKLKLIQSLMFGNQVLANQSMVEGTGLREYVTLVDTETEWKREIQKGFNLNLDRREIAERQTNIRSLFDPEENTKRLLEWLAEVQ